MATAITAPAPDEIRARRKAAGLTREELAAQADCSLAWLAALERGCIPRRSAVLGRVLAVLDPTNDNGGPAKAAAVKTRESAPDAHAD